ncbi:MAG: hypothetical protein JXQ89_14320 [Pelagimonas sp.]
MDRLKSAALTGIAVVISLISLGFFATFGLALLGFLAVVGVIGVVAAGLSTLFYKEKSPVGSQV